VLDLPRERYPGCDWGAKVITQHENRKNGARILDAGKGLEIMRIGCGVHHRYWVGRGARGAGLGGRFLVGSGAPTAGETGIWVASCGVEDMGAKTPGWRRGSSPEAAKRCASSRRALRATTGPVRMNNGRQIQTPAGCRSAGVCRGELPLLASSG
jgi:hypothetical protein